MPKSRVRKRAVYTPPVDVLPSPARASRRKGPSPAWYPVVMLVLMGALIPVVNNWAHLGGFGGGYLAARTLDPLKAERVDHLAMAVVLLAASILSVIASVLHALYFG